MEENVLISALKERQEMLMQALINGGETLAEDNKVRGKFLGLDEAIDIVHECYLRLNNGDSTDDEDKF